MIEKSRLEELIKEGATIWSDAYDEEVYLNDKCHLEPYHNNSIPTEPINDYVLWVYEDDEHINKYFISDLEEDVKSAKWALKYQRIPHTEYLDLPTWEEIQQYIRSFSKELKTQNNKNIVRFPSPRGYFSLIVYRCYGSRNIYLDLSKCQETLKAWTATEENYIKACDLCVKLFKGEE